MRNHLPVGAAAGISAGFIMGVFYWLAFQSGAFAYNPFHVLSSVFLPDELAYASTGTITSIVVHLGIAGIIGMFFAVFVPAGPTVLWGLGLGLFLQFFFGAVVTPVFTFVPPFWEMDFASMMLTFSQRLLFGASLGYLYGVWARQPEREKAHK